MRPILTQRLDLVSPGRSLRGHRVNGFEIKKMKRKLKTGLKGVTGELRKLYQGSGLYNGYIIKLTNITKTHTYHIDLSKLRFSTKGEAVLSQVDRAYLKPSGKKASSVFLRIVAKPSSISSRINLPVSWVKKDTKK